MQRPSQNAMARVNSVKENFRRGKKSARGRMRRSPVASPAKARVGMFATPAWVVWKSSARTCRMG